MDTNIFTWALGAHGFFQLAVKARSELAQSVVGGKGKASKLKTAGYRWGWVVEPRSISVMSKRCQKSCVHRVMNPDKARTVEAVCNRPDYIHHSKKTPRVIVSLRTMREHDIGCAHNITVSRWLLGISPRNCGPCASTDAAATPSTQDQSDVNAISQTPVTVVDSALQSGPPVLHERPKWDSWTSEEEPMQVSEKKKGGGPASVTNKDTEQTQVVIRGCADARIRTENGRGPAKATNKDTEQSHRPPGKHRTSRPYRCEKPIRGPFKRAFKISAVLH